MMVSHRPGDMPLSEPMVVTLLTHIFATQPQWVNTKFAKQFYEFNIPFPTGDQGNVYPIAPHGENCDFSYSEHPSWSNLFVLGFFLSTPSTLRALAGPTELTHLSPYNTAAILIRIISIFFSLKKLVLYLIRKSQKLTGSGDYLAPNWRYLELCKLMSLIYICVTHLHRSNTSWSNDAILRHKCGPTSAIVMAGCLTAPNHHMN